MPWCAPAENKGGALGAKGVSGSRDVWVTSGVEKWEQTGCGRDGAGWLQKNVCTSCAEHVCERSSGTPGTGNSHSYSFHGTLVHYFHAYMHKPAVHSFTGRNQPREWNFLRPRVRVIYTPGRNYYVRDSRRLLVAGILLFSRATSRLGCKLYLNGRWRLSAFYVYLVLETCQGQFPDLSRWLLDATRLRKSFVRNRVALIRCRSFNWLSFYFWFGFVR